MRWGRRGSGRTAYGGASGGHVNQRVVIPSSFSSVGITIGGGGGYGGYEDGPYGKGGNATGWGGGGGGSESVTDPLYIAKGITPGGNGGSSYGNCEKLLFQLATNGTGVFSKTINGVTLQAGAGNGTQITCGNTKGGNGSLEGGGGGWG